jgi:hypothetical protein
VLRVTPVAVGKFHLNYPYDDHSQAASHCGFDVTTQDDLPVLRRVRGAAL